MLKREVQAVCKQYDLRPAKSKGQNFLIDDDVVKKIIAAAKLSKNDTVLEIGPGLGVLTQELIAGAGKVIAAELDRRAAEYLRVKFAAEIKSGKLQLAEGDALKINFASLGLKDYSFRIISNLPYSITSHFFRIFLELGPKPADIVVMIQNEVARRLIAKPGEMNLLALSAQLYAEPEILFAVSSGSFWPEPEVESAVVRLKLKKTLPDVDAKALFRLAKIGFSSKRKQLHNNLSAGLKLGSGQIKKIFADLGWREDIRAQDLSLDDWIQLVKFIR